MKKLLLLLLFSFLFQSCFSYKSVNFNDIKNEKKQKFEVSKLDKTNIKGRLVSIDENVMILLNRNGNQTINENEIYEQVTAINKSYFIAYEDGHVEDDVIVAHC